MRRVALALIVLGGAGTAAEPALADQEITAAPLANQFAQSDYTIDQGERLVFRNTGISAHNVTSSGSAAFESGLVDPGGTAVVAGAQSLTTGNYPFECTLHPGMTATLHVTGGGTPIPPDTTRPRVAARISPQRLRRAVRIRRLAIRLGVSEKAKVGYRATTRFHGRTVTLIRGSTSFGGAGSKGLRPRLTRAGRRTLARLRRARITLKARATDPAGNTAATTMRRTLRR